MFICHLRLLLLLYYICKCVCVCVSSSCSYVAQKKHVDLKNKICVRVCNLFQSYQYFRSYLPLVSLSRLFCLFIYFLLLFVQCLPFVFLLQYHAHRKYIYIYLSVPCLHWNDILCIEFVQCSFIN